MNMPYVKEYDNDGILINPIRRSYISKDSNRRKRRMSKQKEKLYGARKQFIECKDKKGRDTGELRIIKHLN